MVHEPQPGQKYWAIKPIDEWSRRVDVTEKAPYEGVLSKEGNRLILRTISHYYQNGTMIFGPHVDVYENDLFSSEKDAMFEWTKSRIDELEERISVLESQQRESE